MFARRPCVTLLAAAAALICLLAPASATGLYAWRDDQTPATRQLQAIAPPPGFVRQAAPEKSFASWLRGLPLKPPGTAVNLFDGRLKGRQDVHAAVIDIDVGRRDLQQCADAVTRLRAEWLYATGRRRDIAFNFTGGGRVPFARYAKGERPNASGKTWRTSARPDASYKSFRKYMDLVFAYAGTASLEQELQPVALRDISIGDVFIKGGFPGHAVLVADMAVNEATSEKRFLLIQSYMPAQDMHVLKNPADAHGGPWYALPASGPLITPEWTFAPDSLRRWP